MHMRFGDQKIVRRMKSIRLQRDVGLVTERDIQQGGPASWSCWLLTLRRTFTPYVFWQGEWNVEHREMVGVRLLIGDGKDLEKLGWQRGGPSSRH